ncbi:hypothetical protein ACFE04_013836 [Oxalis oulophora]
MYKHIFVKEWLTALARRLVGIDKWGPIYEFAFNSRRSPPVVRSPPSTSAPVVLSLPSTSVLSPPWSLVLCLRLSFPIYFLCFRCHSHSLSFPNTNYYKIRLIINHLHPQILEVLRTPDFRNCKACQGIRQGYLYNLYW